MTEVRHPELFWPHLLARESGIDPSAAATYEEYWSTPFVRYWRVNFPGRAERDPSDGSLRCGLMTVSEYFQAIGLTQLTPPFNRETLEVCQFRTVNPLGFIGFQFGEAILIEMGYYDPFQQLVSDALGTCRFVPSYYDGSIPEKEWSNGRTEKQVTRSAGNQFVATDVNLWRGSFTGLDGISSLSDLMCADQQLLVFHKLVKRNLLQIRQALVERELGVLVELLDCRERTSTTFGQRDAGPTWSGVAAGAHLCGASAVISYLAEGVVTGDEVGTSLASYIYDFSRFALEEIAEGE